MPPVIQDALHAELKGLRQHKRELETRLDEALGEAVRAEGRHKVWKGCIYGPGLDSPMVQATLEQLMAHADAVEARATFPFTYA